MGHTKYRDFTFSYIISRFHLENIDVPFLSSNGSVVSSNGSVVYKRTSYHAKGLVCYHENCFTVILFPSFFCNIRRIAPRFDWTLMERWRKTPAFVSTSMVARRAAPRFRQLRSLALRRTQGFRRSRSWAAAQSQPFRFLCFFIESCRIISIIPSRVLPKLSNNPSRLLSKFVE